MSTIKAIANVAGRLSKIGVGKEGRNKQQGYAFRSIDSMYNTLAPVLAEEGLVILPTVEERVSESITTKSGAAAYHVSLKVRYTFLTDEGTPYEAATYGESIDTSDKATNKALTAAYKYMLIQVFCIPLEGEPDADMETLEPGDSRITAEQVADLQSLLEERGGDNAAAWKARFLRMAKVSALEEIHPNAYEILVKRVASAGAG